MTTKNPVERKYLNAYSRSTYIRALIIKVISALLKKNPNPTDYEIGEALDTVIDEIEK
jgi:hypothetical protein